MANEVTSAQLREWYKNFADALYKTVNIDLNRWEDLGRIKHFTYTQWPEDAPETPEGVEYHYTFMPRNGNAYVDPAPDIGDLNAYKAWMQKNLQPNPNPTDAQLRELYELSQSGMLMVFKPGMGIWGMQQVWTDENGKIVVTPSMGEAYMPDSKEPVPEGLEIPESLDYVKVPKPEDFNLAPAPVPPVQPENPNPGFWSWVGYLLGMDTDYAKMVYAKNYPEEYENWYNTLNQTHPQVIAYNEAVQERQNYLQAVADVKKNHMTMLPALTNGMNMTVRNASITETTRMNKLMIEETAFLKQMHEKTPQGQLLNLRNATQEYLDSGPFMKKVIKGLMGNKVEIPAQWVRMHVIDPKAYHPAEYEVAKNPGLKGEEAKRYRMKWEELAAIASFAALSHPEIAGKPPIAGLTLEESATNNYLHHISCDFFTDCRKGISNKFLPNLEEARVMGSQAALAYSQGDPKQMGSLLGQSVRRNLLANAQIMNFEKEIAINSFEILNILMEVLDNDPKLMENSGLTEEEIKQARADVEFHKLLRQGTEAKLKLQQHALYQVELSDEELREAMRDVLFLNVISNGAKQEREAWQNEMTSSEAYMNLAAQSVELGDKDAEEEALEEAIANNAPDVAQKQKALDDKKAAFTLVNERLNMMHVKPIGSNMRTMLLDKAWTENAKQELLEHSALDQLKYIDREELGKIVANRDKAVATFGIVGVDPVKTEQKEQNEIVNEVKNENTMVNGLNNG